MADKQPYRIKTISEYHRLTGLPKPEHPLISVIHFDRIKQKPLGNLITNMVFDFYIVSIRHMSGIKYKYGQQRYDFEDGVMFFLSPNQVFGIEVDENAIMENKGWSLLVHPDFLWNTSLANKIKQYEFFDYSVNEALFLSDKEQILLDGIVNNIEQEYHSNIDKFSKSIIISHLDNLLSYSERFYNRQFITREKANLQILERLEQILLKYFNSDELIENGLPTVQYVADKLNISPKYLGSMLRVLTGQNAQQHIHTMMIEKAKEKLSTTTLSVSEIAYQLGFEHPQSFSRLFKAKTNLSPLEFRAGFS